MQLLAPKTLGGALYGPRLVFCPAIEGSPVLVGKAHLAFKHFAH
jgi:hypothetical protein